MAPQWVKDYVERHNLQLMFEEAANAVVKAKAEEPAAFLVSLAKRRSYPEAPAPPRARPRSHSPSLGDDVRADGPDRSHSCRSRTSRTCRSKPRRL